MENIIRTSCGNSLRTGKCCLEAAVMPAHIAECLDRYFDARRAREKEELQVLFNNYFSSSCKKASSSSLV